MVFTASQTAHTAMEQLKYVFNKSDSSQAAMTTASVLKEGIVFEDKASFQHDLKTHAALHGYVYEMQLSNSTTFMVICRQREDANRDEGK